MTEPQPESETPTVHPYDEWLKNLIDEKVSENAGETITGVRFGEEYDTLEILNKGTILKKVKVVIPDELLEEHLMRRKDAVLEALRKGTTPYVVMETK